MMTSAARAADITATAKATPIQTQWEQRTAKGLDDAIPGCLDSVGLLAGVANTIMQLAHPGVGYGVIESRVTSGSLLHHPFKRTRTTLTYLAVAMHGSTEEKLAYRKSISRAHAQVTSTETSPVQYRALDPELQLWVAACLFWGYVDVFEKFRGPMTPAQLEEFYEYAKPLGTTLQVRPDMWPKDINAFWEYWNAQLDKVQIDDTVRKWLGQLMDLSFMGPVVSVPMGKFARLMTGGFLHPKIRAQMQIEWTPEHERDFRRMTRRIGGINQRLPRLVRQLPTNALLWDFRRRMKKDLPLN